ncbi:MAG: hypothetical protein LBB84_09620 [Tannerellaceae bacterium]|jgi:hypothetical protein|nr:hypothetical protein [Tannerellaceae bacterium]
MAQSVSNDALWVKLSEMDKKLDTLSEVQKSPVLIQEPAGNKSDFSVVKEEIITKINAETVRLGQSSDSHFEANTKNIETITETIQKVWNIVSRIRKQQREAVESQGKEKESCFNFWFFKVRKTSLMIAILGILIFVLTLFSMKQQNDYSLLMEEYYRQGMEMKEMKAENVQIKTYTDKRQK